MAWVGVITPSEAASLAGGLGLILAGGAAGGMARLDRAPSLPWQWLALFGFVHGVRDWLVLLQDWGGPPLAALQFVLLVFSSLLLLEFAREGSFRLRGRTAGLWIYIGLVLLTSSGGLAGWAGLNVAAAYALGLTGGLWAAAVLWQRGRVAREGRWAMRCGAAGVALLALANAATLPPAAVFPAVWLNDATFARLTGLSASLARALLAGVLASALWQHYLAADRVAAARLERA